MGFLDKFKKQKEREVEEGGPQPTEGTSVVSDSSVKKGSSKSRSKKSSSKTKEPTTNTQKGLFGDFLLLPHVTEKAARLASSGQYVFFVEVGINAHQVRQAVKTIYGITPTSVRMQHVPGKRVSFRRVNGTRQGWKKATVTLPKGKTIEVFERV